MKLGAFSFGGGAAMLGLLRDEIVLKKKWLNDKELMEITGIAESTPGPIAINVATYIGYKRAGIIGGIFSTLGVVTPSFVIIFIISLFFENLLDYAYVVYALDGVKCAVIFLILKVGFGLCKEFKKDIFALSLFIVAVTLIVILTIFAKNFSAIYYILGGCALGLLYYGFYKGRKIAKSENKGENK